MPATITNHVQSPRHAHNNVSGSNYYMRSLSLSLSLSLSQKRRWCEAKILISQEIRFDDVQWPCGKEYPPNGRRRLC